MSPVEAFMTRIKKLFRLNENAEVLDFQWVKGQLQPHILDPLIFVVISSQKGF